jgi:hypothetical protein
MGWIRNLFCRKFARTSHRHSLLVFLHDHPPSSWIRHHYEVRIGAHQQNRGTIVRSSKDVTLDDILDAHRFVYVGEGDRLGLWRLVARDGAAMPRPLEYLLEVSCDRDKSNFPAVMCGYACHSFTVFSKLSRAWNDVLCFGFAGSIGFYAPRAHRDAWSRCLIGVLEDFLRAGRGVTRVTGRVLSRFEELESELRELRNAGDWRADVGLIFARAQRLSFHGDPAGGEL